MRRINIDLLNVFLILFLLFSKALNKMSEQYSVVIILSHDVVAVNGYFKTRHRNKKLGKPINISDEAPICFELDYQPCNYYVDQTEGEAKAKPT